MSKFLKSSKLFSKPWGYSQYHHNNLALCFLWWTKTMPKRKKIYLYVSSKTVNFSINCTKNKSEDAYCRYLAFLLFFFFSLLFMFFLISWYTKHFCYYLGSLSLSDDFFSFSCLKVNSLLRNFLCKSKWSNFISWKHKNNFKY